MKVALVGKGKTGGKILDLVPKENLQVFDSKNPVTVEELSKSDVAIVFVNGETFINLIPLLLSAKIPVVTGATGFAWPKDIDEKIKHSNQKWITASNFSLGMRIAQEMIQKFKTASKLFDSYAFSLNEVHHTKKLDAPSGTALSWQEWLGEKTDITSEREGDIVGIHELTLKTSCEQLSIRHEALDRKIFAEGALWAAKYLISSNEIEDGLHYFENIVKDFIKK